MANALHKATLTFRKSVNTPEYLGGDWVINPDMTVINTVPKKYWKISGDSLVEMDAAEKIAVDASLLPAEKRARMSQVDQKTGLLIAQGHQFGGSVFSLSQEAQRTLLGMYLSRDSLVYPVNFNLLDNSGVLTINDAATVELFYGNALLTMRAHLDSGTALKDQIRAAATKLELDAVVDNR